MIKTLLVVSFLILSISVLLMYFFQRNLIYFPAKEMPSRQVFQAEDMQQVSILTADGLYLNSWYKPAVSTLPTLLYLHGNAGHIGYRMPLLRQFLTAGFGVLLLEYRGYGGNKGKPSEQGLYMDGRAAMQFLQQQGVAKERIVLYGESLGSGVATHLAVEFPVCALILQSPFTTMSRIARYHYPWLFLAPWDKFDSLTRISKIHRPLLILHGTNDLIVPYEEALVLFEQANEPKELISIPHKGHNDLWQDDFANRVMNFIRAHCI